MPQKVLWTIRTTATLTAEHLARFMRRRARPAPRRPACSRTSSAVHRGA